MKKDDGYFMNQALQLAQKGIILPNQFPFGAVVVKNGKIVGRGIECTLVKFDPTAHSEIEAIRDACKFLKTTNLDGCQLFTSCEPCSMCLATIFWAKIKTVYYACPREQAIFFGFGDHFDTNGRLTEAQKNSIHYKQYMKESGVSIFSSWHNER